MREAPWECRAEYHLYPVHRIGDAVADLVARRVLHPAIGRQNPECRQKRARGHHQACEEMQPGRHAVPAEQHYAQKARLQEEGHQHLVAQERADHVAGGDGELAPIRAELVGHGHAGDDSHGEGYREYLRPVAREPLKAVVAAEEPDAFKRRDIGRQPNREGRKDDVKSHRERELDSRQERGIHSKKHRWALRQRHYCGPVNADGRRNVPPWPFRPAIPKDAPASPIRGVMSSAQAATCG